MTTSDEGQSRPVSPISGEAGLFAMGEWVVYRPGDEIHCPGRYRERRTTLQHGRRVIPRVGPCRWKWGRCGPDKDTWVRQRRIGCTGYGHQIFGCPDCHCPIEFQTHAASEAA